MNICILTAHSGVTVLNQGCKNALLNAFLVNSGGHDLVDNPKHANIILFADEGSLPAGLSILLHPAYLKNSDKCFVYSHNDFPGAHWMRGVFLGLSVSSRFEGMHHGGHYIREENSFWEEPLEFKPKTKYLFSFCGSLETHNVRYQLKSRFPDAVIESKRRDVEAAYITADRDAISALHMKARDIASESEFILCPRGVSPSSIRVFEAMRMGRSPVIISDDWIPSYGPEWSKFSLRIKEKDIESVHHVCELNRHRARQMGHLARLEWERWFSPDQHFMTIVSACLDLEANKLNQKALPGVLLRLLLSKNTLRPLKQLILKSC